MKNLIEILPEPFKKSAVSLEGLGIYNLAWQYKDCIKVIEYLAEHNFFILGGDVYTYDKGIINSTYDSWHTNKNDLLPRKELIELGKNRALLYIKNYKLLNNNDYCYSIVIE